MRLIRAVGVQALGAVFCAAVSFALLLLLGRALGTADFGRYVLLLNLASLGLVLIEAGWPTLLYRQGAQAGSGRGATAGLMRAALFHVLIAAAALALAAGLLFGADRHGLALALLCMGAVAAMNLVSARMRGLGAFGLEAGWQSTGRLVSAGLIVVLLWVAKPVEPGWVFGAWALGLLLVLGTVGRGWLVWPRAIGLAANYRRVLPFLLIGGLTAWLLKGDVVLLGSWRGLAAAETLSFYAAATRLNEAALLLFAPLGNVLLGRFSALAVHADRAGAPLQLRALAAKAVAAALFAGGIAVGGAVCFGAGWMGLLFGRAFSAGGDLLPWVLAMLPFALGNLVLLPLLTALGRERILAVCLAVAGLALLLLLPWLAARMGARGAALAMALAHALVFVLGMMFARKVWRAEGGI